MYIWCSDMCAATASAAAAAQDDLLAAHTMAAQASRSVPINRIEQECMCAPSMAQDSSRELQLFLVRRHMH